MTPPTFAQRLQDARFILAHRGQRTVPLHLDDQLQAAEAEALTLSHRLLDALRTITPGRGWKAATHPPSLDAEAHVLAAVLACLPRTCPHLRNGGPQPAYAQLPLGRVDCTRCLHTLRLPPAEDADRCDLCGARGIAWFVPIALTSGPLTVIGDVCSACAGVLGLKGRGGAV